MEYLNSIDPNIKFTFKYSKDCIEFLDVLVISDGHVLSTDLFYKETDSHQFLHFNSCHPYHTKKGIPYGQALRIRRICSKDIDFEKRSSDLIDWLTSRGHDRSLANSQIDRARLLNRDELLEETNKSIKVSNKTYLVMTYHPALSRKIYNILKDNQNILTCNEEHQRIFSEVPMVSFRRAKTIKDILVRSKLKMDSFEQGSSNKCNRKNCMVDRSIDTSKVFSDSKGERTFELRKGFLNCNSKFVVYKLGCRICGVQYIGSTITKFRERFNNYKAQFRKYLKRKNEGSSNPGEGISQANLFEHFCSSDHNGIDDWSFQLIDQSENLVRLRERESFWQHRLNSFVPHGLNEREVPF